MPFQLTSVVGALTKNKVLYLRFTAKTGESVSIFNNSPVYGMILRAYPELVSLQDGQRLTWEEHPICVELFKDTNGYFSISRIEPRSPEAVPDVPFTPDLAAYRQSAINWAGMVTKLAYQITVFDMETTTNDKLKAEPLSIGLYKPPVKTELGEIAPMVLNTFVKPLKMSAVSENVEAAAVHQITPEMLTDAPEFCDVFLKLSLPFTRSIIVGYNVDFDLTVLHRTCARHSLIPIHPLAVIDVIQPVSWFMGDWNPERQSFNFKSLSDAAAHFHLEFEDAHNALADCEMTWAVIEAMAGV